MTLAPIRLRMVALMAAGFLAAAPAAALKLAAYRKISPGPLEEALLLDHPSGRARVSMSMRWKAEQPR